MSLQDYTYIIKVDGHGSEVVHPIGSIKRVQLRDMIHVLGLEPLEGRETRDQLKNLPHGLVVSEWNILPHGGDQSA